MYTVISMRFFENDIVRAQSAELVETNEDLQDLIASGRLNSPEGNLQFMSKVHRLIELQEQLYFRASYSDDEDAREFVNAFRKSFPLVAVQGETDVTQAFRRMKEELKRMIELSDS